MGANTDMCGKQGIYTMFVCYDYMMNITATMLCTTATSRPTDADNYTLGV